MGILKNLKWELFAQEVARGTPGTRAYLAAGYKANAHSARVNASKLLATTSIRERVDEILCERSSTHERGVAKAIERVALSKEWVLARLIENAERALQRVPVLDSRGQPTGEYRYDGAVANRALELLGKEQGMFIDRKSIDVNRRAEDLSDSELAAYLTTNGGTHPSEEKGDPSKLN
jgi:phage terminase small subunit